MEFKVSKKEILRKKYIVPIFILLPFMALTLLVIFLPKQNEVDLIKILFILASIAFLTFTITIYITYKFIQFSKVHKIQIHSKGISFFNNNIETFLPWNKITKVNLKGQESNIKKLSLQIEPSNLIELSIYTNLETLNLELKKYLNTDLWKY